MSKKQISVDENIKKFRKLLSHIEDEDELQFPLAKWLNKGNWEKIDKFLETNEIDGRYFFSIAGIFFALSITNPNEEHVHNIEKFKNNIVKTEYNERLITLLQLENDAYLMNQLKVDNKKIEQLKNFCKIMVEDDNRRYNYKSYLCRSFLSIRAFLRHRIQCKSVLEDVATYYNCCNFELPISLR